MNFVKKNQQSWLYAGNSAGRSLGHLQLGFPRRRFECFQAVGLAREIFHDRLSSEIIAYLKDNSDKLLDSGISVDLSLFMIGKSSERSIPIVMFVSEDKASRRDAFKLIRGSGIIERYPGFDVAHIPLKAEFEHLRILMDPPSDTTKAASTVQVSDKLPIRRIGITSGHAGEAEARRLLVHDTTDSYGRPRMATAGGLVCFQGQYMFLTVNHCFEEEDDNTLQGCQDLEAARQGDDDDCEIAGFSDLYDDEADEDIETTSRGSISSSDSQQEELTSSDDYGNTDEAYTVAASIAISQGNECGIINTPSLLGNPVQTHVPEVDSTQHLEIAMFSRALDTSLILVQPPSSIEESNELFSKDVDGRVIPLDNYMDHVEAQPRDAAIKTITPDGGVIGGTLSGTLSFFRLPHLKSFQKVYTAKFNQPLVPGDCGSWVRDAITGKLFGHVIAGSPSTGLALIMPASDVFATALKTLSKYRSQSAQIGEASLSRDIGRTMPPAFTSTAPTKVLPQDEEWNLSNSYSSSLRRLSPLTASPQRQHQDEEPAASSSKHLRASDVVKSHRGVETNHDGRSPLTHRDYSIAWICALPLELEVARYMLDEEHQPLVRQTGDDNNYILGRISQHNVVIASLPGGHGTKSAANAAVNLKHSFPSIHTALMVGIGSGAPRQADLRLGDVVVGTQVMQYNIEDESLATTARSKVPPRSLLSTIAFLQTIDQRNVSTDLLIMTLLRIQHLSYTHPRQPDRLFISTFEHPRGALTCDDCDLEKLQPRQVRTSDNPKIHFGVIASGDKVIENAKVRDDVSQTLSALCLETEAVGLMDHLPCLLIRGVHDYADSHKSNTWKNYAAAAAAACARQLLEVLPPTVDESSHTNTELNTGSKLEAAGFQASERRQQLLRSLDFPQIDARKTNIQVAHAGTCQWLLQHSLYQDWIEHKEQSQNHGLLWIRGTAGAGKSTLMKYAEANHRSENPWIGSATFFFNARGDYLERSTTGMYRSLLMHLLERYLDLQAVLDDTNIIPSKQQGCPDVAALKRLLASAVMMLGQRSWIIFIDALDECDEQEVWDMVKFFRDLMEATADHGIHFRICFSSRPHPHIEFLQEASLTLETEPGHRGDLSQYVKSHLRITLSPVLEELQAAILYKAAGNFLWTVLAVKILIEENRRGHSADVNIIMMQRLATIPGSLSELFHYILTHDQKDQDGC